MKNVQEVKEALCGLCENSSLKWNKRSYYEGASRKPSFGYFLECTGCGFSFKGPIDKLPVGRGLWTCTSCFWEGHYRETAPVTYKGIDWQNCPSCNSVTIPVT